MAIHRRAPNRSTKLDVARKDSSSSNDCADNNLPATPPRFRRSNTLPIFLVICVAFIGAYCHCYHVATLHENHLSFMYLSNTERELTFHTEMGFYYSFFKQILLAEGFIDGILSLLNDTQTEYPSRLGCINGDKIGYLPSVAICKEDSSRVPTIQDGINALKRFNIYPEAILAAFFRMAIRFNRLSSDCFKVSIEEDKKHFALAVLPPELPLFHAGNRSHLSNPVPMGTGNEDGYVLSCDGLREPPIFYVNAVFSLSGLTTFGLAISGWLVASRGLANTGLLHSLLSIWGSILPVVSFFFNHGEATRVQWTPPLRESFSYPFFIVQQTVLIWLLKDATSKSRRRLFLKYTLFVLLLLAFQLPWQFAQFALLTQLIALLAAYIVIFTVTTFLNPSLLNLFPAVVDRLEGLIYCQLCALFISFCMQFGNELLLSSWYLPLLVGCLMGLLWHHRFLTLLIRNLPASSKNVRSVVAHNLSFMAIIVGVSFGITKLTVRFIFDISSDDGAHIVDLLRVKFFGAAYRTFHTQLYTCAAEFDFLPMSSIYQLAGTGLLPFAVLAVTCACLQLLLRYFSPRPQKIVSHSGSPGSTTEKVRERILPNVYAKEACLLMTDIVSVFVVFQLGAFAILACLIMRLKLFFVPHLCLTLSILAQPRLYFGSTKLTRVLTASFWFNSGTPDQKYARISAPKHAWIHVALIALLFSCAYKGVQNIQVEVNKKGQFSYYTMETFLNWASQLPPRSDGLPWVFSGAMPTMARIRLGLVASPSHVTGKLPNNNFAITNHPHYENALLRARTEVAYAVCSRKSPEAVWSIYRNILKADFIVIEDGWCHSPNALPGCSSMELWDLIEQSLSVEGESVCSMALSRNFIENWSVTVLARYFTPVFRSFDGSLLVLSIASVKNSTF